MSKIRCLDISSKEFKALQKELLDGGMNINPYILATKVKLWQDGKGDIESMPTAQDLNINPVFNRTDIEESVTADTPEITDVSESDNLNSEKNTIEKELKELNAQIKRNPFKNLGKFFKINNLNKRLNQVNQLLKNLNQQSEQAIAAADIVAESNNVSESTSLSVDESSNVQAINEKTRFAELPDGLKYLLAKYHINKFGFNFGLDQNRFFKEQDYALSVLTDEIIAAIESNMQLASYAQIFIDWNKANNVTAKESTEEIVDEENLNELDNFETKVSEVEQIEADRKAELEELGQKQLTKGFNNLSEATKPEQVANAIVNIEQSTNQGAILSKEQEQQLSEAKAKLKEQGYEIVDYNVARIGENTNKQAVDFYNSEKNVLTEEQADAIENYLEKRGEDINVDDLPSPVSGTIKPLIKKDGIMVQAATVNTLIFESVEQAKEAVKKSKEAGYKKPNAADKINAKYDAKLAALEQTKAETKTVEQIEADRKVDLEKLIVQKERHLQEAEKESDSKPNIKIKKQDGSIDTNSIRQNAIESANSLYEYGVARVNAKYDAELKALETSDIEEQGVVDKQKRFTLKGFRDLLPNLKNNFTEPEERAFLTKYNKITTSEERADFLVELQNLINDKILAGSRESSNVEKEQFLAKVRTINSNIEILRKNRNFPNMKAGFNIDQTRNSLYFTKISKKIVDDFIKSQGNLVYKDLQGNLSRAIEELFNFNRVSQQFSPVAYFKDVTENDLFEVITDELNNFHNKGSLSRNMVQKTNVYLGTRKFPFKVTYDILNRPRLISIERVRKKKAVQKEKSNANLMSLRELSFVLDRIGDYKLTALLDVIQGLGPGGRYGLRDIVDYGPESSTGKGVTSDPSQKGYIFRRTDKVGQKRKLFSTVKGLADKIFSDEIYEFLNTTNDTTNLLEEYLSYGSVDNMIEYLRDQVDNFLRAESGDFGLNAGRMTFDEERAFDESIESFEKGSQEFIENLVGRSDSALSEYFDLRNAYETSTEYKIQLGAFFGTRESLETDVQRALYDKVEEEKKLSEKEPGGTVDAPKSAEPVGDSFMDMLNKESNSLKSVLYSETKTNLDKIGLDIDLEYAAIVKKIKELKTAGTINMNSVVDIINIVLNKEFIERKDGKEGQIKLVNELLVEALRMGEISGNFTVQETIQNINPGTYFVQINSNGNLVFTEIGNNDSKTPTTISLIDFIVNSSSQSSEQFKIIKSTDANFNSPIADAVMSKEDLKGLTENLSDIFSNFGSNITEFDNLELADLKAEIVTEFNKCK